jgi:two-component sensor histidine kinase/ActR/RegA family two-component response regulator
MSTVMHVSATELPRVLLVDDHPENLLALESLLDGLDVELVRANSGTEALKSLLNDDFALILLDVQMPGMDGFETATLIRSRQRSRYTPIIFVTAIYKSDENVHYGYAVGAADYITKPLDSDVLKAKVASFVDLAHNTRALEKEITRRREAEDKYRRLNASLEKRVRERTATLEKAVADLTAARDDIQRLNAQLRQAMTETHHRIKNNLQVITAMVDLQVMQDCANVPVEQLMRLGTHVKSLALVHDFLTHQAKDDGIATHAPAGRMLEKLIDLIQMSSADRRIETRIEDTVLTSRQCSCLALLTSELIGNAMKHGQGTIKVSFSRVEEAGGREDTVSEVMLTIEDEGPGFGKGFDPEAAGTTGLALVQTLSQWDLNGRVDYSNTVSGARVSLRFPTEAAQ